MQFAIQFCINTHTRVQHFFPRFFIWKFSFTKLHVMNATLKIPGGVKFQTRPSIWKWWTKANARDRGNTSWNMKTICFVYQRSTEMKPTLYSIYLEHFFFFFMCNKNKLSAVCREFRCSPPPLLCTYLLSDLTFFIRTVYSVGWILYFTFCFGSDEHENYEMLYKKVNANCTIYLSIFFSYSYI